jgi:hypothetical protein
MRAGPMRGRADVEPGRCGFGLDFGMQMRSIRTSLGREGECEGGGGMMARNAMRWTACAVLTAVVGAGLAGCSDDDTPASSVSKAASAASSLASRGADALSSASAEAHRKLDEIKGGVDAKDAVRLGRPTTDGGRTAVDVTAENATSSPKSFTIQINFKDSGGNLLDTAVVTVSDVPAGKPGTGTARSNRTLSGTVQAEVTRALRY